MRYDWSPGNTAGSTSRMKASRKSFSAYRIITISNLTFMKTYLLALLMLGSALTGAMAQKAAPQNQGKTAAGPAAQQAKSSEKPVNQKGLINVTKQGKEWFFEVPKSLLGRRMLTTTRFISVPHGASSYGGEQVNQQVVYFEKASNGSLLLRVDMFVNSSDTLDAINKAVVISNEAPIIASFPIDNEAGPNIKIKVGGFFSRSAHASSGACKVLTLGEHSLTTLKHFLPTPKCA